MNFQISNKLNKLIIYNPTASQQLQTIHTTPVSFFRVNDVIYDFLHAGLTTQCDAKCVLCKRGLIIAREIASEGL